jgi:hypothetical protein
MGSALACAPEVRSVDSRCARVQAELRRHWREVVRREPPRARERFLNSQEGIVALGAQTCRELLKAIWRRRRNLEATAAGASVLEAWERDEAMLPGFEFDGKGRLKPVMSDERRRRGAVRLKLSRVGVRAGMEHPPGVHDSDPIAGVPTRRWTPPQAVGLEDELDGMSAKEALGYAHAISCSAAVIIRIGEQKAKPKGGKW